MQERAKRGPLTPAQMKVANAAEFLPYLRRVNVDASFEAFAARLSRISPRWDTNARHADILDDLEDLGGLGLCPEPPRRSILEWLIQCYIGEPGGYGQGRNRPVFYSNVAASMIERIIRAGAGIRQDFDAASATENVQASITNKYIRRRWDDLSDLAGVD